MIATPPPRIAHMSLAWIAVGVALIGPWIWLVAFDRLLRRRLRSRPAQAR
jgi:hypothetical protein